MAFRVLPALAALFTALAGFSHEVRADEPVPEVKYDEGAAPPPSARWKLLGYGAALAAGSYGVALAASYNYTADPSAPDLRLPIVGPWIKLGHTELCPSSSTDGQCSNVYQVAGAVFVALDGVLQAGALGLLLQAAFMRTQRPVAQARALRFSGTGYSGWTAHDFGPSRPISPFAIQLGHLTLVPSFSSVRGAEASFGWVGTF